MEFEGTGIVVSHDRYFLNRVVDLLIVLDGSGNAQVIHGNYDTYELMRAQQQEAAQGETKPRKEAKAVPAKKGGTPEKPKRKRQFPYRKVEDIEADIAAVEGELKSLEERLASPELYRDGDRVRETTQAFEQAKVRLQSLYEHWEEAVELN